MTQSGALFYGDNLDVLRRYVEDESVDLVYLDPPFNSNVNYNVLFAERDGSRSAAQIKAFGDTWRWDREAAAAFEETIEGDGEISRTMQAFRTILSESNILAYLAMMAPRLAELHRVMKPTGSLYLHCDPTASHYLKLLLDSVFGPRCFRSEVIWKRSSAHSDTKQGRRMHGHIHDVILFYTKSDEWTWNAVYTRYDASYIKSKYTHVEPDTGRRYQLGDLTAAKPGGDVSYEWHGRRPYKGRYWAYSKENMDRMFQEGRIYISTYSRGKLKQRLFEEGYKKRRCEMCGQDEHWRGHSMSLILDHINGIPDDNRIENLRIVCPNCAATLDTHCGRKNRREPVKPCASDAAVNLRSNIGDTGIAREIVASGGIARCCEGGRSLGNERSSGRRTGNCWMRSRRRAIWPLVVNTGFQTTPCASGFGSTRGRLSGKLLKMRPGRAGLIASGWALKVVAWRWVVLLWTPRFARDCGAAGRS
jgi:DNA methylase